MSKPIHDSWQTGNTIFNVLMSAILALTICAPAGFIINAPSKAQAAIIEPGSVITGTLECIDGDVHYTWQGIPTDGYYQYRDQEAALFKFQIRTSDDSGQLAESFNGNWFWMECVEYGAAEPETGDIYNFSFTVETVYGRTITGTMDAGINKEMTGTLDHHQYTQARMSVDYNPPTGGLQMCKASDAANITDNNQLYSFGGIEFGVWTDPDCSSETHGTGKSIVLTTGGYGHVEDLDEGTYYIRELPDSLSGTNYAYNGSVQQVNVIGGTNDVWIHYTANGLGDIDGNDITNSPISDEMNLRIRKVDAETGGSASTRSATLAGAKFKVSYFANTDGSASGNAERVWYYLTDESGIINCMDEGVLLKPESSALFKNAAGDTTLPLGTYTIEEVKAPKGYLPAVNKQGEKVIYKFVITEDGSHSTHGTRVYYTNQNGREFEAAHTDDGVYNWPDAELIVSDQIIRGNVQFNKLDEDSKPIANCPFLLRELDDDGHVIEQHIIVTDENGLFDSSFGHSVATNANDAALTISQDGTYKIDSSKLNPNAGIWFGVDANGEHTTPDDSRGALPYGKYELIELAGQANINLQLVESRGIKITHENQLVNLGTLTDKQPNIKTSAHDGADGDSELMTDSKAIITDVVTYENLNPGQTYTVSGYLVDKSSGQPLLDAQDQRITASASFTPAASSGSLSLDYSFDASALTDDMDLVVFETLSTGNNITVAEHADVNDMDQTIRIAKPNIKTSIQDETDGDRVIVPKESLTLVDTVSFSGLTVGKRYELSGVLVDKTTGRALEVDGQKVIGSTSFIAHESQGEVPVTFTFDSTGINDKSEYVAFETLTRENTTLAVHADLYDINQTVTMERPRIATSANDQSDGDQIIYTDTEITIIDTVSYKGLVPGQQYKLRGKLMDKNTGGELKDANGSTVKTETEFTPEASSGSIELSFTFDASHINTALKTVAFETLLQGETELASHSDLEDAGQTVTLMQPRIATTARDALDGDQVICRDFDAQLVDTVSYTGLQPGKTYTVSSILMNKLAKEPLRDTEGNEITATKDFVAENETGTTDITFLFDATLVNDGDELVCFETLLHDNKELATHMDLEDRGQTVTVQPPTIATEATDTEDGDKIIFSDEQVSITDIVSYSGLTPGKEYVLEGTLMNKDSKTPVLDAAGNMVTAKKSFTPTAQEGSMELEFTFDSSHFSQAQECVAFENLYRNGKLLAAHADIDDSSQTVTVAPPEIQTSAIDASDKDKTIMRGQQAVITDYVTYSNLTAHDEYALIGTLMINDGSLDGTPALDAFGNPVSSTERFTPEETHGTTTIDFQVDSTLFDKDTKTVVFEELQHNGVTIATHRDIKNEDQTVAIVYPNLKTNAADTRDDDQELSATRDCEITDTVEYAGLNTGETYTVFGKLMDKATGNPVSINNQEVTSKASFVATQESGKVEVKFQFDASGLAGKELVAFEQLRNSNDVTIAEHEDINDTRQTVHIVSSAPGSAFSRTLKNLVKTGDKTAWVIAAYLICVTAVLAIFTGLRKRSR